MHCSRQMPWVLVIHQLVLMSFSLAFLTFLLFPHHVSAHAILLRSDPPQNSILSASPAHISMWFSEDLNPIFSTAYVVNAANNAVDIERNIKLHVDKGDARISADDSKQMDISLKANLPSAVYVVLYRTQSADDGHVLYGSFLLTVKAANGTIPLFSGAFPQQSIVSQSNGSQLDGPAIFGLIMVTLVDLGSIFWVGAQIWFCFIIPELELEDQEQHTISEQMQQRFNHRFSWWVLLVVLLANVGVLGGQALSITSSQWLQAFAPSMLVSLVDQGHFGTYWVLREMVILLALVVAVYMALVKQPSQQITASIIWGNFILGVALLVALTQSGHAASTRSNVLVYAVLADFLHLGAAALWLGGMMFIAVIYLPVLKSRSWLQQTISLLTVLPRYSPLAIAGVVLMGLSGPLSAATRLLSWDQLITTAYGLTLILKVLLVGVMILDSAMHVLLFRPHLAKDFKVYQTAMQAVQLSAEENDAVYSTENEKITDLVSIDAIQMKELEKRIMWQTHRLSTTLRWEPVLGIGVLVCTGLLTIFSGTLQPTTPSLFASRTPTALSKPFTATVGTTDTKFQVAVKIDPDRLGANTFIATVLDSQGTPVPTSSIGVSYYTTMLDVNTGTQAVNLQPDGQGHFRAKGKLSLGGRWQLRIEIRTLDTTLHEAIVTFSTLF